MDRNVSSIYENAINDGTSFFGSMQRELIGVSWMVGRRAGGGTDAKSKVSFFTFLVLYFTLLSFV